MFYPAALHNVFSKANDKPALATHPVATYEKKRNAEYLAYETDIQEENILTMLLFK